MKWRLEENGLCVTDGITVIRATYENLMANSHVSAFARTEILERICNLLNADVLANDASSYIPPKPHTLAESKRRMAIEALYDAIKNNAEWEKAVDWEKFAEYAAKAGLKYHPALGLMDMAAWDAIKEFVVEQK